MSRWLGSRRRNAERASRRQVRPSSPLAFSNRRSDHPTTRTRLVVRVKRFKSRQQVTR